MDVPTERPSGSVRIAPGVFRTPRRRRPTGEPPPLPHHIQHSGARWLTVLVAASAAAVLVFLRGLNGPAVAVTVVDDAVVGWLAGVGVPGYLGVMRGLAAIGSWWVINVFWYGLLVALLVLRRIRHLIVVVITAYASLLATELLGGFLQRPRPFGVPIRVGWGGWALPSLQIGSLAGLLVMILYTMVPEGRLRNAGKWLATGVVAAAALGRMALGAEAPTDVLLGTAVGVTIPLIVFRIFTPSEIFPISYRKRGRSAHLDVGGARGVAIRRALEDQLGLHVEEIKPFGLSGSAGSTPLRIKLKADPPTYLFGKLYARGHLRADRWYKLGRELLYGRLEDEKPFNTVRRLVQQEDYALSLMHRAGLPTATPYGFVELTPDREYLLVTEFFAGATELGEAEVNEQIVDSGLHIVRKMWDAGLAHRDVKPANLLVRDGEMLMIDVAFAEARPSPWRQAIDLANMMLCLALRCGPELVYERARQQFTVEEISEAFAAARGLALPSQLRHMIRNQGRDLHAEFVKLLPSPPEPISIQRWSARRIGLVALLLVLAIVVGVPLISGLLNNDVAVRTPLVRMDVSCGQMETQWLFAQSVPSATEIPCTRELPPGWQASEVTANAGRSTIDLGYDRINSGETAVARMSFTASCAVPTAAMETTGVEQGVRRSVLRTSPAGGGYAATWFDRFPGGCVTTTVNVPAEFEDLLTTQLGTIIGYNNRLRLQQALANRSDGRLQLDP